MPPRPPKSPSPAANPVQALEADLTLKRAQALWDQGLLREALQACNDVLRIIPDHAQALYMMGMLALEIGALDIAVGSLERAAASAPGMVKIRIGLGQALAKSGEPVKAIAVYTKALQLNAGSGAAYRGIGLAQLDLGQPEMALRSFRKLLKLKPDDAFAAYVIAALTSTALVAPQGYVPTLFDDYAEQFDSHLTGRLGYRVPLDIVEMVAPHLAPSAVGVDLGCGTGLMGIALGGRVGAFDGIDLSPRMLAKAQARGIYRTLRAGDATEILNNDPAFAGPYDLVTAADVFVYIGWLEPVFATVRSRLAPGGLFAFSVESMAQGSVEIRSSGRFVHSRAYVAQLSEQAGLTCLASQSVVIRQEINTPVAGMIYLLQAP